MNRRRFSLSEGRRYPNIDQRSSVNLHQTRTKIVQTFRIIMAVAIRELKYINTWKWQRNGATDSQFELPSSERWERTDSWLQIFWIYGFMLLFNKHFSTRHSFTFVKVKRNHRRNHWPLTGLWFVIKDNYKCTTGPLRSTSSSRSLLSWCSRIFNIFCNLSFSSISSPCMSATCWIS